MARLPQKTQARYGRLKEMERGSGNGKTHTAVSLGLIVCGQGKRVAFKETSKLILELSAAHQEGRLKQKLDALERRGLIILDEWGHLPCDPDGAKLPFRVISLCCEKISLLFTTNIDFSRWGAIFSDSDMARAMLDRAIHHGRLVTYDRESYRMRNSLMRAEPDA